MKKLELKRRLLCERKTLYFSAAQAQKAAKYLTKKLGILSTWYKCKYCELWHIGKK